MIYVVVVFLKEVIYFIMYMISLDTLDTLWYIDNNDISTIFKYAT